MTIVGTPRHTRTWRWSHSAIRASSRHVSYVEGTQSTVVRWAARRWGGTDGKADGDWSSQCSALTIPLW